QGRRAEQGGSQGLRGGADHIRRAGVRRGEEGMKRRRQIRRRRAHAGRPETRYWAHLVGFSKPIPIWASTLTEAYGKAGAAAIASGEKLVVVTLTERGGS